ncbi:MAG: hypothetical protein JW927_12870 [Deltaproteobacteria bacterium]|nr:hypothetical protein [Deltaproteobacteria bacterium]
MTFFTPDSLTRSHNCIGRNHGHVRMRAIMLLILVGITILSIACGLGSPAKSKCGTGDIRLGMSYSEIQNLPKKDGRMQIDGFYVGEKSVCINDFNSYSVQTKSGDIEVDERLYWFSSKSPSGKIVNLKEQFLLIAPTQAEDLRHKFCEDFGRPRIEKEYADNQVVLSNDWYLKRTLGWGKVGLENQKLTTSSNHGTSIIYEERAPNHNIYKDKVSVFITYVDNSWP